MSKRIYPVTVENGELVESNEKLTVNGLPIAKDGTIDSSYVSGGSSEWEVDANGDLVPVDGEPVSVGSLRSDEGLFGVEDSNNPGLPKLTNARSGAPRALTVQPDAGDAPGSVETYPSGTAGRSHFIAANANDPDNFGFVELEANGSDAWLNAASKGTGTAPTQFIFKGFNGWSFNNPTTFNSTPNLYRNLSSGVSEHLTDASATSSKTHNEFVQWTDNVGTTATTIFSGSSSDGRAYKAKVFIWETGSNYAMDEVNFVTAGSHDVISSVNRSAVPARTYSVSSSDLQVALNSSSANVAVSVEGITTLQP